MAGRTRVVGLSDAYASRDLRRISLRRHRLPTLATAGVIDFDTGVNTVSVRDAGVALLTRLDATTDERGGGKHHVQ